MRMGLLISHKDGELRRALLPDAVRDIEARNCLVFETGYAEALGIGDDAYREAGAQVASRAEVLGCEILCDVKLGDADYLDELQAPKVLVGWAHSVQKTEFTSAVMRGRHTVLAWEHLYRRGRYVFYRNREIAGEAAILHGFRYSLRMPYDASVCIIGNGQTAKGAMRILHGLGTRTLDVFPEHLESLFRESFFNYNVIVNCVLWDTSREDRLLYRTDLARMRPGSLIIDVSCDPHLEIETSRPTSIDDPVYVIDGVVHYAVDNTPAMFPQTVTKVISQGFAPYVAQIIAGDYSEALRETIDLLHGRIMRDEIVRFRERLGLYVTGPGENARPGA